jgi:hypothetical protein
MPFLLFSYKRGTRFSFKQEIGRFSASFNQIFFNPSHMGNAVHPQNTPNLLFRKTMVKLHSGQEGDLTFDCECFAQTVTPALLYFVAIFPHTAHFIGIPKKERKQFKGKVKN